MIDFKALTDEKLVDMYRGGDERAFSFLLEKHRKEIDGICRRRYLIDSNEEDVKQYGYMGFMKAAQSFDKDKGSFVSFMRLCVLSTVDNAVKKSLAQKQHALNDAVSIEYYADKPSAVPDPLDKMISDEEFEEKKRLMASVLSKGEKQVFNLFLEGYSYTEIAKLLELTPKQVDNAITRIKRKKEKVLLP